MPETFEPKDIDQLLVDADELISQITADAIMDMEEEARIQFEMHAQRLKTLRAELQNKTSSDGAPESGRYGEGMHQAILDIVTAMKNLGSNLRTSEKKEATV